MGAVTELLKARGIEAGPGSVAGHLSKHFQPQPALSVSEDLHQSGLALPLHAGLSLDAVNHTVKSLHHILDGHE